MKDPEQNPIPIPLRVHSQYTLLGGTSPVEDLVQRAQALGTPALALTDTNALYGAVAFDRACRSVDIHPIIGMTTSVALPPDLETPEDRSEDAKPLVLLAIRPEGYRALCALSSQLQGHPDREARLKQGLQMEDLQAHRKGLICLTGGLQGWLTHLIKTDRETTARLYAQQLEEIYGENLYLSLEIQTLEDLPLAHRLAELGGQLNRPTVVVHPVYAPDRASASRIKMLEAIRENRPLDLSGANEQAAAASYWLDPHAMRERYAAFPDALQRTTAIAARCADVLPDGTPLWPDLDLAEGQTPEDALGSLAHQGLRHKYGPIPHPEVRDRLKRELEVIARYGYTPLFLVVTDIVRYARDQEIPISTRGSVANSLVAYSTGITTVDPIRHDLLFERFLSPARVDPPDIDLDLCSRRRDEVLSYVRRRYGEDRVALVATYSTLQPRSAVRAAAKAYDLEEEKLKRLLQKLPRHWHPNPAEGRDDAIKRLVRDTTDAEMSRVLEAAYPLIGQIDHLSVHPGGLVITPGPLTDVVPVQWTTKGYLTTQYDHHDVEALGLPKIDLLGIRALTVLADTVEQVRTHHNAAFRLSDIPLDDSSTAGILAEGETVGIFQCESVGARRTLRKLKARDIQDLAIANAFFKPGPATGGMAEAFVQRYRGEAEVSYLHPSLERILGATKGVLIFQEQILRVATEIAGLSWEQAGHLRRGMSKMNPTEMAQMRTAFKAGCRRDPPAGPGMTAEQTEQLWTQVEAFSGYGFNQGHATAYADVSYRSAYLKTHWPAAFFCARLQSWGGFHHPAVYMAEAIRLGIDVRPPHVNSSRARFSLIMEGTHPVLRMGLGEVRDLRHRAIADLIQARRNGVFEDLRDFLSRVPLRAKEITHLIQCGALDGLGPNRPTMLALARQIQRAGSAYQLSFDFLDHQRPNADLTQHLAWEKQVLGYPIDALRMLLPKLSELKQAAPLDPQTWHAGQRIRTIAVRLPGWTGGGGFYLWDGNTWVIAKVRQTERTPVPWRILDVEGHWCRDRWGMGWIQVRAMRNIANGAHTG